MKRPYIVCHMVESIDGRIDCGMVDKISGDEYYSTLESLGCPASVEGRVTMEHYYALHFLYRNSLYFLRNFVTILSQIPFILKSSITEDGSYV